MDKQGFRAMVQAATSNREQIEASLAIAERFETYLIGKPANAETALDFSKQLIQEGNNTRENYLALIRYCRFIENHDMYVALLELVDGGEVGENLHRRVAEHFGATVRDEVFAGTEVPPLGTPNSEKPAALQPVITRLQARVGRQACANFLSASLRDLPDEHYLDEREKYQQAGGIDAYLVQRKEAFVAELETCLREKRPFFAQQITQEVADFVKRTAEMGGGVRKGGIIYEIKIPYMAREYLSEPDATLRRYYYCHCPWARETIKGGAVRPAVTFCYCSAGYHKKPFEVIFGQPLRVEVLESVLLGGERCRFAIHLPKDVIR